MYVYFIATPHTHSRHARECVLVCVCVCVAQKVLCMPWSSPRARIKAEASECVDSRASEKADAVDVARAESCSNICCMLPIFTCKERGSERGGEWRLIKYATSGRL